MTNDVPSRRLPDTSHRAGASTPLCSQTCGNATTRRSGPGSSTTGSGTGTAAGPTPATAVAATGLIAGAIAVPAGIARHHAILPVMANGAQLALPPAFYSVYTPTELVLLTLAGPVIAIAGALAPASWAARTPTALALRAE